MDRLNEFEFGSLPDVMYHGAEKGLRNSIETQGLKHGYATPHTDLASEYGSPDIYEVRKHPNMLKDDWFPDAVYANNIPPSHVKRVGHVVSKIDEGGEWSDTPHWHKAEDCHLDYDVSWPKGTDGGSHLNNVRPHPTYPSMLVANY